jgi:hypothetical protein
MMAMSDDKLRESADLEDQHESVSVGGMAADLGALNTCPKCPHCRDGELYETEHVGGVTFTCKACGKECCRVSWLEDGLDAATGRIAELEAEVERLRGLLREVLVTVHCPFTEAGTPCGECEACTQAIELGNRIVTNLEDE